MSIAMFTLFALSFVGQVIAGHRVFNEERSEHGETPYSVVNYLRSAHFVEATFENWESEFLQMGAFVLLTAWLVQKGSSESRKPAEPRAREDDKRGAREENSPWPVHRGGIALRLYEHSLSGILLLLFAGSFVLHVIGGAREHSSETQLHGGAPISALEYLGSSQLWFESFQNWQSEFFSIWALLLLTVFLREKGSPQSKPVTASNEQTGAE